jgi:glycine cleavage system H protein
MVYQITTHATEACVWMTAGVLSYKLCDRKFDCEHCPLDAALCGTRLALDDATAPDVDEPHGETFPDDRLYSIGHTWLMSANDDGERLRFGLDRFASALLTAPRAVRWRKSSDAFDRGALACEIEIDAGLLHVGTPINARIARRNPALEEEPGLVVTAPYGRGWLIELAPTGAFETAGLLPREAALEQARLDLRRFRRRVAHHLLAGAGIVDPAFARGGEPLTDLSHMLGAAHYLELVRDLVH